MLLVEQVGHISPTADVQALGYPFECHRCLLAQHSGCFDLLFISFWALLQLFFRPVTTGCPEPIVREPPKSPAVPWRSKHDLVWQNPPVRRTPIAPIARLRVEPW